MTGDLSGLVVAVFVLTAVAVSFFISASAGLGGSLVLVPTLALVLGTKEGVALAALLLAANNVVKVAAYRHTVPYRRAWVIVALTVLGALVGSRVLVDAPETIVTVAVILSFAVALIAERRQWSRAESVGSPALALASGATSGFSGTSGPLKGVAIKSLRLDRLHTVGAAALVSLFGDLTKTAVFTEASLLGAEAYRLAALATPLMFVSTFAGRRFNSVIGERGYQRLFWLVMGGYTARLLIIL